MSEEKILGCDQLTRPEEIGELNRFLKKNIGELEDSVELGKDNLWVGGEQIKKISELPQTLEKLSDEKETSLSNYLEKLTDSDNISLSTGVNKLQIEKSESTLENKKSDLVDLSSPVSLSDKKEQINDTEKDVELSSKKENLTINDSIKLSDNKENINIDKSVSLSDKKENITVNSINELSKNSERLTIDDSIKLSDSKKTIKSDTIKSLDSTVDKFIVTGETKLINKKEEVIVNQVESLSDLLEKIDIQDITELSSKSIKENIEEKATNLSDFISELDNVDDVSELNKKEKKITVTKAEKLSNNIDKLKNTSETNKLDGTKKLISDNGTGWKTEYGLYDSVVGGPVSVDPSLSKSEINIAGVSSDGSVITKNNGTFIPSLSDNKSKITTPTVNSLETNKSKLTNVKPTDSLVDSKSEIKDSRDVNLSSKKEELVDENRDITLYDVNSIRNADNLKAYYDNIQKAIGNDSTTSKSESIQKLSSLLSAYLSGDKPISNEQAKNYEALLSKLVKPESIPPYKLNNNPIKGTKDLLSGNGDIFNNIEGISNSLNPSNYLRQIAESIVQPNKGASAGLSSEVSKLNEKLLDETLAMLIVLRRKEEELTKSNRDRLPGNTTLLSEFLQNGVTGAAKKLINDEVNKLSSVNGIDFSIPHNYPKSSDEILANGEVWESLNNKSENPSETTNSGGGYSFIDNYLSGSGIELTLSELTNSDKTEIQSVDNLKDAIINSPYMSSPTKFTSTADSRSLVRTIDSNASWEIIFRPYCGELNGGLSFLPSIEEINTINKRKHGVRTMYSKWLPITTFELTKGRLLNKTLSLYDGEISYPISKELSNELRLSFADDQYKSIRAYFEMCMNASIYNSEVHGKDYYKFGGTNGRITAIDSKYLANSPYKNITFECIIYSMTPQKSTINKYDLLLILRDFSEERYGEISASESDLNVTFNIVGENPPAMIEEKTTSDSGIKVESPETEDDFLTKIKKANSSIKGVDWKLGVLK